MSNTIARLPFQRFVRRATSGMITNTQWLGALAAVRHEMLYMPWHESLVTKSELPVNVPTTPDFGSDAYDAYKQSGSAATGTGKQAIFAGMAAYRIPIPPSASGGHVVGVRFGASADKFCVGGLKVSAVLSDFARPPDDWMLLRQGGHGATPDDTGKYATVGTVDDHGGEVLGILADTSATIGGARNHAGTFELDLSENQTAYDYLYLIVSLFDYGTWRREYWVEGSGAIDGASIEVIFEGDVSIPESTNYDIRLPLRTAGKIQEAIFSKEDANLYDDHLRMLWGVRMLQGGLGDVSNRKPMVDDADNNMLAPRVAVSGINTVATGYYVECYRPEVELAGRKLWLRCVGNAIGASPVRVSVIDSDDTPDATDTTIWSGTSKNCIGSAVATRLQDGDAIAVDMRRDARSSRLWLVVSISDIAGDDVDKLSIGYADGDGISLKDAHISRLNYIPDPTPPREGIVSFAFDATKPGMIFGGIRNIGAGADAYAISVDGSATDSGTSYGSWKRLGDDYAAGYVSIVRAGARYVLGLGNGGRLFYAGDITALDDSIDWTSATGTDFAIVNNGVVMLKSDGTCQTYGTATTLNHGANVNAWSNVFSLRGTDGVVAGITNNLALVVSGLDVASTNTLTGLVNVIDIRLSTNRLIVLFSDFSVMAWSISGKAITAIDVSSWSNIRSIACTNGAVWGVSANGDVHVESESPLHSNFYKADQIPAGRKPVMLVGSNQRRLAVGYAEEENGDYL